MKIKAIEPVKKNNHNGFITAHSSILKLFQLLLYFPFSWNQRLNKVLRILSVITYLVLMPIIFSLTVYTAFNLDAGGRQSVNTLATKALVIINVISVWVHLIEASVTASLQAMLFSKLNEIDQIFSSNNLATVDYEKEKKNLRLRFVILITISTILELLSLGIGERLGLIRVVYVVADLLNYFRCAQVLALIGFVKRRLKNLKMVFENTNKDVFIIEFEKFQKIPSQIESIKLVNQLCGKLYGVFILINDCFGWSLLSLVTFFFLDFTCSFYWLYLRYQRPESVFEALYSILPKATLLLLLCSGIQFCNKYALEISKKTVELQTDRNEDVQLLARETTVQILQEPYEVSAKNFLKINFEMLGSMLSGIATYLIILIQFNDSEHSE